MAATRTPQRVSWLLSQKLPHTCNPSEPKWKLSQLCVRKLNAHIQSVCYRTRLDRVYVLSAEHVVRSFGCVLPCGWKIRVRVPCKVLQKLKPLHSASVVSYLRQLCLPLTPVNRTITDKFLNAKKVFLSDFYWYQCFKSKSEWEIEVIVSACCPCAIDRY